MYDYKAHVRRVVDGDTIDFDVDLGFHVTVLIRTRIARIDTPEMNTAEGKTVKSLVQDLLPEGSPVTLHTEKGDRYGRWIAEVSTIDGLNLSDWLLNNDLAVLYK